MSNHPSDRIIGRRERRHLIPYSDVHILRLERAGKFPARIQLGPSRVGWSEHELLEWIEARKLDRNSKALSAKDSVI